MKANLSCQLKSYIQPFERELAYRELEALTSTRLPRNSRSKESTSFSLMSAAPADVLARELAFWESVSNGERLITNQVLRESTVYETRKRDSAQMVFGELAYWHDITLPNRRCLRYGPHGVHEYRGKFFPQLVRALINIGRVPTGGIVADPFSGSGTTAIETILAERMAIGLDLNPLSVFMTQVKCEIIAIHADELERASGKLRRRLARFSLDKSDSWLARLCVEDQEYLSQWFHGAVLKDLDRIGSCILDEVDLRIRRFMLLCLSNILRRVSWQKEVDLRVRRELKPTGEIDPVKEFLDELDRSTRVLLPFLRQESRFPRHSADIRQGDSKHLTRHWTKLTGKVDAVITSPPYATALPYLDTDRLSLCFLGLLNRSQHRSRDREMIGNREIGDKVRKSLWEEFCAGKHALPSSVWKVIVEIDKCNQGSTVGFRRRNLPALLYKYFADMGMVFEGMIKLLTQGASAFVVVGNNHTVAGGHRIQINTVELLRDLAEARGFETVDQVNMEMLTSRDIFKKNAIDSESILHFRKRRQ